MRGDWRSSATSLRACRATYFSSTPMMSLSFMMSSSCPSIFTSVPLHLPNRTLSPFLQIDRDELAALVAGAGTDGDDLALLRLLGGRVGDDDAAGRLGLAVDALDDDAVMQRTELHEKSRSRWRARPWRPVSVDGMRWHYVHESAKRAEVIRVGGDGCQGMPDRARVAAALARNLENERLISMLRAAISQEQRP